MMNKINQLKTVAFLKLAESRVISHENLFRVCPKDMEKFDQFWGAFERNLDVYIKNMIAADGALVVISKKIADELIREQRVRRSEDALRDAGKHPYDPLNILEDTKNKEMLWLREIRGERSQQAVADEIGIAQSTYASIEVGSRKPSVTMAKKIAAVMAFDWTKFFEESTERPEI